MINIKIQEWLSLQPHDKQSVQTDLTVMDFALGQFDATKGVATPERQYPQKVTAYVDENWTKTRIYTPKCYIKKK